ncbi:MAG TPA: hypothetical protein EYQ86_04290, partial [Bacteroidetes bacterium]|nr:hypothetical protein [Bacteroidota bacterium]
MSNTVSNVLILVEPPAPKVTEKNSGLNIDKVFTDAKKGEVASQEDLQKAFSTTDLYEVAEKIIKKGEMEL